MTNKITVPVAFMMLTGIFAAGCGAFSLERDNDLLREQMHLVAFRLDRALSALAGVQRRGQDIDRVSLVTLEKLRQQVGAPEMGGAGYSFRPIDASDDAQEARASDAPSEEGSDLAGFDATVAKLHTITIDAKRVDQDLRRMVAMIGDRDRFLASLPTLLPAQGYISSEFGVRTSPIDGKAAKHKGLDIAAPLLSAVVAPADGVVRYAGVFGSFGNYVSIDHGYGIVTKFAHNSAVHVKAGDMVKRGQLLASVGASGRCAGIHLHYEVWVNGQPVNPRRFLEMSPQAEPPALMLRLPMAASAEEGDLNPFSAGLIDPTDKLAVTESLADREPGARSQLVRAYLRSLRRAESLNAAATGSAGGVAIAAGAVFLAFLAAWQVFLSLGARRRSGQILLVSSPDGIDILPPEDGFAEAA